MRKKLIIPLAILSILFLNGVANAKPPVKKVYAYKQAVIPGIVPRFEENEIKFPGKERKENFNYWFYLELRKSKKIAVTGLWINGKELELKAESVNSMPVKKIIYSGASNNDTIIMMPFTRNKVMFVFPSATSENKSTSQTEKSAALIKTNELVIRYEYKGKIYFASVAKIKVLPPDARA